MMLEGKVNCPVSCYMDSREKIKAAEGLNHCRFYNELPNTKHQRMIWWEESGNKKTGSNFFTLLIL